MYKSEKLIADLVEAKIIADNYDKAKVQLIIRQHFCEIHNEAVLQTVMANNRPTFKHPQFLDK